MRPPIVEFSRKTKFPTILKPPFNNDYLPDHVTVLMRFRNTLAISDKRKIILQPFEKMENMIGNDVM